MSDAPAAKKQVRGGSVWVSVCGVRDGSLGCGLGGAVDSWPGGRFQGAGACGVKNL